jgi:nicotinamidase-related amidase
MRPTTPENDYDLAERLAHIQPLRGFEEKVHPKHTALIVIDMQNDFIAPDGLIAKAGRDVAEAQRTAELIKAARHAGVFLVFVRNVYTSDRISTCRTCGSNRLRAAVAVGTYGSWSVARGGDFYGDVRPRPGEPIVTKHRYSSFLTPISTRYYGRTGFARWSSQAP